MFAQESVMDFQKVKELALANGFSLKEQASGNMDLHSYVYEFANAIEQAAKAQAVPEGFVLVPKEPTDKTIAHMINTPIEVNLLCDHADTFLSEGEAYIAYKAMIEAQEQK